MPQTARTYLPQTIPRDSCSASFTPPRDPSPDLVRSAGSVMTLATECRHLRAGALSQIGNAPGYSCLRSRKHALAPRTIETAEAGAPRNGELAADSARY